LPRERLHWIGIASIAGLPSMAQELSSSLGLTQSRLSDCDIVAQTSRLIDEVKARNLE
jgi:hypothetical protein